MYHEFENIPPELRARKQWVAWKYQDRNGKQTKVPYSVYTGKPASSTDPTTWATFDDVVNCVFESSPYDGIGFVFTAFDPYCGIDLDKCIYPEGPSIESWARNLINDLHSYTELSPTGRGIHIVCRAVLPEGKGRKGKGIEIYDRGRYFTFTGNTYHKASPLPILERQSKVEQLLQNPEFFPPTSSPALPTPGGTSSVPLSWQDIQVVVDPTVQPNVSKFMQLMENKDARHVFEHKRETHENSPSAIDMALARYALQAGWSDQEITNLLIYHRATYGYDKTDRLDYYQRTLFTLHTTEVYRAAEELLDDLSLAVPANGAATPVDPNVREKARAVISTLLTLDIQEFIQHGRSPASYSLLLKDGAKIALTSSVDVRNQSRWQDIVQEYRGVAFASLKPAKWQKFLHCLSLIRVYEEIPESDEISEFQNVLDYYLKQRSTERPESDDALAQLLDNRWPYHDETHSFFTKQDFGRWSTLHNQEVSAKGIMAKLRMCGAQPCQIQARRNDGALVRRNYWRYTRAD